jgi:hypothetical protein
VSGADCPLPAGIGIIQFYYDDKAFPWRTEDDGWLLKTYASTEEAVYAPVTPPDELVVNPRCGVAFAPVSSLPDWEGIWVHQPLAGKLSCVLNEDEPWDAYDKVCTELLGEETDYRSQLGGYPKWIQSEASPETEDGKLLPLLFQLDSEQEAGLMWGDTGLVYLFYNVQGGRSELELQCL